jgi:ATP-dependent protease ClpP protease subunit
MTAIKIPHLRPDIRIFGDIDEEKLESFLEQLDKALDKNDSIVFELTTAGGDADLGRRIADEIKFCRQNLGREIYFFGKTTVYSIGAVIMSAFPVNYRFLERHAVLMVHERRITKDVHFDGPMSATLQMARELVSQFEAAQTIEMQDYHDLAAGSSIDGEEILKRARSNWYIHSKEALDLGLIAGII